MAEITEVFDDLGEGAKKVFKNKKFWLAALAVGGVALVAAFLRYREEDAAGVDSTAYGAIGYAGYPTVSGGSGGTESDSILSDSTLMGEYESDFDSLFTNVNDLSDRLTTAEEATKATQNELNKQQIIIQMKANSELYNALSGAEHQSTREALHAENLALAEKLGAEYDASSGNYFIGDNPLYTTAQQQKLAITGGKTEAGSGKVGYTTNRDYQKEINDAIMNGADATTINELNAARDAKIQATGSSHYKANTAYDPNVDYSALIAKAKEAGADQKVIANLTMQRQAKIDDNPELKKYQ